MSKIPRFFNHLFLPTKRYIGNIVLDRLVETKEMYPWFERCSALNDLDLD